VFILFPSSLKHLNFPLTVILRSINQLKRLHQEHVSPYLQAARRLLK
jgi:hypothetical protein